MAASHTLTRPSSSHHPPSSTWSHYNTAAPAPLQAGRPRRLLKPATRGSPTAETVDTRQQGTPGVLPASQPAAVHATDCSCQLRHTGRITTDYTLPRPAVTTDHPAAQKTAAAETKAVHNRQLTRTKPACLYVDHACLIDILKFISGVMLHSLNKFV